jgi:SAM-dependent methyltransferase
MWFEDETFWRDCYQFMFSDESFSAAHQQLDRALSLTTVRAGAALDLCCGPGRHSVPLAKKGFCVTGVDRSPFLLAEARTRAMEANVNVELVLDDMRSFSRASAFDLVINLSSSFGYFDDRRDDLTVLQNIHDSLRPGGWLIIDMECKEWLARRSPDHVSALPDGSLCVRRHTILNDWTRQRSEWIVIRGNDVQRFELMVQVYSGQEFKNLLAEAGLVRPTLYGDLDGRPFGSDVNRLVATAQRAEE